MEVMQRQLQFFLQEGLHESAELMVRWSPMRLRFNHHQSQISCAAGASPEELVHSSAFTLALASSMQ